MTTDLQKLRTFADGLIAAARFAIDKYGRAGAATEIERADSARELLALLDSLPAQPALTAEDIARVVRGVLGYAVGAAAEQQIGIDIEHVASRVAARLAGRAVEAALTADDVRALLGEVGILTSHGNAARVAEKLAERVVSAEQLRGENGVYEGEGVKPVSAPTSFVAEPAAAEHARSKAGG